MVEGRQLSLLPSSTKKNNKKDVQLCFNMNNHGWEDAGNQWESNWNLVRFRELGEQYGKRYRIHWNLTLDLPGGERALLYSSASQPVGFDPFESCIAAILIFTL